MPTGIFIIGWNDNYGAYVKEKYPDNLLKGFSEDDLLAVFTSHSMAESGGIIGLKMNNRSILSYSPGNKKSSGNEYVVGLILKNNENPTFYEEILPEISYSLLDKVEDTSLKEDIQHVFRVSANLSEISQEQRFAFIYNNKIQNLILDILRDGPIDEEALMKWISRELKIKVPDLDDMIISFEKSNLIRKEEVNDEANSTKTYYFLLYDISLVRVPPTKCVENLKELSLSEVLKENYLNGIKNFFKHYEISPQDIKLVASIISKPENYQLIKILRENFSSKRKLMETLDIEEKYMNQSLAKLKQAKIIYTFKDKKDITWVFLMTDIRGSKVFAKYLFDKIYRGLKSMSINKKVALQHLELLKSEYQTNIK